MVLKSLAVPIAYWLKFWKVIWKRKRARFTVELSNCEFNANVVEDQLFETEEEIENYSRMKEIE
jgi:hypothetical protein